MGNMLSWGQYTFKCSQCQVTIYNLSKLLFVVGKFIHLLLNQTFGASSSTFAIKWKFTVYLCIGMVRISVDIFVNSPQTIFYFSTRFSWNSGVNDFFLFFPQMWKLIRFFLNNLLSLNVTVSSNCSKLQCLINSDARFNYNVFGF